MHYQPKQDLLNDRIILVTGASDGIGREAAMTYARYGATVILLGRNEEKLRQVASHINEETGRQPQWFILDLLTCTSENCHAGIRTRGLLDPNQARYQASPHPEF